MEKAPGRVAVKGTEGAKARLTDQSVGSLGAERRLLERVRARTSPALIEACASSSVPPAFLQALTANESGGDPSAVRFEPAVYRHLKAVAAGRAPAYGALSASELEAGVERMLHPKSDAYHAHYLAPPFAAEHTSALAAAEDELLRELASSWGFTQIMGYHTVGRAGHASRFEVQLDAMTGTVRDLTQPRFHFRVALELLADFAARFELDLGREFEEMFRCWNTGSPYGATFDPEYVEKGLRRMEICRELAEQQV